MTVRTKIDPIDRDIELMLREDLSPEAQSAALASFAEDQLNDADELNRAALGYVPTHDAYVDGARTTDLTRVRPDGTILFEFDIINDVFAWIDLQLITHAPVKSGLYRRSFIFTADAVEVDPNAPMPDALEYVFTNVQPYARKIERAHDVFQAVAALAANRFGNIAKIKFGFEALTSGAIDEWANTTTMKRRKRSDMKSETHREWLRRQPAIVIRR